MEQAIWAAPSWEVGKTSRQIILRWDAVEGAEGYTVYKAAASSEEYTKVKSVTGTRCTVTGLKKGKAYKFAVKAQVSYEGAAYMSQTQAVKTVTTPKILKRSTKGFENTNACKVLKTARKKLGCAYVYGAAGPNAFDCSGYVYYIYKQVSGIKHGSAADHECRNGRSCEGCFLRRRPGNSRYRQAGTADIYYIVRFLLTFHAKTIE